MAGIKRQKHILGLTGRGQLAGRFTRNIDYDSDDYGDGLIRIPFLDQFDPNDPPRDWDSFTTPPPGYAWKKTDVFTITVITWGYDDRVHLATKAEYIQKALDHNWLFTIAQWEAAGSPTYGYGRPNYETGYVRRVGAITGAWIAPNVFYVPAKDYSARVLASGEVKMINPIDTKFQIGAKFNNRSAAYAWYNAQNEAQPF